MRVVGLSEEAAVDQRPEVSVVQTAGDLPGADANGGGDESDDDHRRSRAVEDISQYGGHAEAHGDQVQHDRSSRNQQVAHAPTNYQSDGNHLMANDRIGE